MQEDVFNSSPVFIEDVTFEAFLAVSWLHNKVREQNAKMLDKKRHINNQI